MGSSSEAGDSGRFGGWSNFFLVLVNVEAGFTAGFEGGAGAGMVVACEPGVDAALPEESC